MNKLFYLFVLAAFIPGCSSEPHYVIKGNIEGSDNITFLLQKREEGKIVTIDSAISKKSSFKMNNFVVSPELVQLVALNTKQQVSFYLENSGITIVGKLDSLSDARITGSKTQDEYKALANLIKPLSEKYRTLYTDYQVARQANDTAKMSQLEKDVVAVENEMKRTAKDFVRNNTSSYVVPSILKNLSTDMEADQIEATIKTLDTNVAKVKIIKELKALAVAMKTVEIGHKAPDFTLNQVNGSPVALSSKIGSKLLLIDFWAAWCNPCRQENPYVLKVYNTFHKKGFDVFGVSLDYSKDAWVKAIADDKLSWTNVSDLQYWDNAAAKLYVVNSIPSNFLLDETGTIIARNLRGEDLFNKVNEIMGKK